METITSVKILPLQGLDDMESDLFGGSLTKKDTPSKSSKSSKTPTDTDSKERTKTDGKPPSTPSSISPEPKKSTLNSSRKGMPLTCTGSSPSISSSSSSY